MYFFLGFGIENWCKCGVILKKVKIIVFLMMILLVFIVGFVDIYLILKFVVWVFFIIGGMFVVICFEK